MPDLLSQLSLRARIFLGDRVHDTQDPLSFVIVHSPQVVPEACYPYTFNQTESTKAENTFPKQKCDRNRQTERRYSTTAQEDAKETPGYVAGNVQCIQRESIRMAACNSSGRTLLMSAICASTIASPLWYTESNVNSAETSLRMASKSFSY